MDVMWNDVVIPTWGQLASVPIPIWILTIIGAIKALNIAYTLGISLRIRHETGAKVKSPKKST